MNKSVISQYFEFIQKHCAVGGAFLNVNRYEKSTVGEPIRISEYPYDDFWKTEISETSIYQPNHHFLLTSRLSSDESGDIFHELKKIEHLGKKFYEYDLPINRLKRRLKLVKPILNPLYQKMKKIF